MRTAGTTTATVLTRAIFGEGCKSVAAGMNPMDLRRGIQLAVDTVVKNLKDRSTMISTTSEIAQAHARLLPCTPLLHIWQSMQTGESYSHFQWFVAANCQDTAAQVPLITVMHREVQAAAHGIFVLSIRSHPFKRLAVQVGTISANGEREIGDLISKAMERVGKEGVITVSVRVLA